MIFASTGHPNRIGAIHSRSRRRDRPRRTYSQTDRRVETAHSRVERRRLVDAGSQQIASDRNSYSGRSGLSVEAEYDCAYARCKYYIQCSVVLLKSNNPSFVLILQVKACSGAYGLVARLAERGIPLAMATSSSSDLVAGKRSAHPDLFSQ